MKKLFVQLAASAAVLGCCMFAGAMSANAATIDDVITAARQSGYPEELIQQGVNMYYAEPDKYPPETLDTAISSMKSGQTEILDDYFGEGFSDYINSLVTTTSENNNEETTQTVTTTVSTQGGSLTTTPSSSENNSGLSFERISKEEFINMTYEEKKAYIASLSTEQAQEFLNSLSPEELRSMMSQLPSDKKLEVVDNMAQVSETLGMNVTVDNITDEELSLSVRDDEGTLVGVAAAGVVVEDTGYDYRLLFSISGMLVIAAAGGLVFVARKCFGKQETGVQNEQ